MDIGFHLTKYSTSRKFVISVDLAMLLLHDTNPLDFYYDGKEQLKGVLRDTPYPVTWIDMQDFHFQDHEQNLLNFQSVKELKEKHQVFFSDQIINEVLLRVRRNLLLIFSLFPFYSSLFQHLSFKTHKEKNES